MYNLAQQASDLQYYLSQQLKEKLVLVTIDDICHTFSKKKFKLANDDPENLRIKFNIAYTFFQCDKIYQAFLNL